MNVVRSFRKAPFPWTVLILLGVMAAGLTLHDIIVPRERELSARAALAATETYRRIASPRLGVTCRFRPTCSHYADGAVRKYGLAGASWRTAWRIARCNPWTEMGTEDWP
jgi:putative membrane protein insertion efficiency factor